MRIDVLTIFPEMFAGPFGASIIKRAVDKGLVTISLHDIRDWTTDRHRSVDDAPFGGGAGMVMKPDPLFRAVEAIRQAAPEEGPVVLLGPAGTVFNQRWAERLSQEPHLTLICGHYEGIDERVREHLATVELSIGDFVLTGGEIAAMAIVDATVRLLPGVLTPESLEHESHTAGLLEYPQYTRPAVYRGWEVPDVLLSGNHARIARWRREQSILRTASLRPDLIDRASLSAKEQDWLEQQQIDRQQPGDPTSNQ